MIPAQEWAKDAWCIDYVGLVDEAYERPTGPSAAILKRHCVTDCKVREQCLSAALTSPLGEFGTWGGAMERERINAGAVIPYGYNGPVPERRRRAA